LTWHVVRASGVNDPSIKQDQSYMLLQLHHHKERVLLHLGPVYCNSDEQEPNLKDLGEENIESFHEENEEEEDFELESDED